MCIAILQRSDSEDNIDYDTFKRCESKNSDGMGLMWVEGGKVRVWKTLDSLDLMFKKYKQLRGRPNMPVALHFRNATKGEVHLDNCHPFFVDEDMAMMHNGTLDIDVYEDGKSDTLEFRDKIIRKLPDGWLEDPDWKKMINKYSGWSRFIFTLSNGYFYLVNEDEGHWRDGVWYSNYQYRKGRGGGKSGGYYGRNISESSLCGIRGSKNYAEKNDDEYENDTKIVSTGQDEGIPHGRFTGGYVYKGVPVCPRCMPDKLKGDDNVYDLDNNFGLFGDDPMVCVSCDHMIYPSKYEKEEKASA